MIRHDQPLTYILSIPYRNKNRRPAGDLESLTDTCTRVTVNTTNSIQNEQRRLSRNHQQFRSRVQSTMILRSLRISILVLSLLSNLLYAHLLFVFIRSFFNFFFFFPTSFLFSLVTNFFNSAIAILIQELKYISTRSSYTAALARNLNLQI